MDMPVPDGQEEDLLEPGTVSQIPEPSDRDTAAGSPSMPLLVANQPQVMSPSEARQSPVMSPMPLLEAPQPHI